MRAVVAAVWLVAVVGRADDPSLHDFDGVASVAAALRASDLEAADDGAAFGVVVKGPTTPEQAKQPVAAEVRRRIECIDVLAGFRADRPVISDAPAKLVGGVGMASEHPGGREALEVRTLVGQREQWGRIGLEVGPRIERRLPGGITLFLDGKAEAVSTPGQAIGAQPLPGQPADGLIGLTGRTGFTR
ncbi:MAG: hypothetical protein EBZ74_02200 [Planctomycetia bacterium]|nr:hypothetical protein [Planctomycetia bacterium]